MYWCSSTYFANYPFFLSDKSQVIELVLNQKRKDVLEKELEKISVPFKFFEVQREDGLSQTQWTRLDGIY